MSSDMQQRRLAFEAAATHSNDPQKVLEYARLYLAFLLEDPNPQSTFDPQPAIPDAPGWVRR